MSNNNIRIFYIYLITNNINGKTYIGQRRCPLNKTIDNDTYMGSGTNLFKAKNKYGLSAFSKEILAVCSSKKEIDILEKCYIKLYKEIGKAEYNITDGGTGGYLGEEWRQRIIAGTRQYWSSPEAESTKMHLREKALAQPPRTKEQEEQRLKNLASFWDSPDGLSKKKELSQKQMGSHTTKGMHWYNDGIKNIQCFKCPLGFVPGRLGDFSQSKEANQKRSDWYNNLTDEQRKEYKQRISNSHKGKHFTAERKKHIGDGNRGRKYYNNGIIEVMQFECPEGFVPGRLPSIKKKISEGFKKNK